MGSAIATVPTDPSNYTRTTSYAYDTTYGELVTQTEEPSVADHCVAATITGWDAYGNRPSQQQANCASAPTAATFATHLTTATYTGGAAVTINGVSVVAVPGAFAYTVTKTLPRATVANQPLSQTVTTSYDPRFGVLLKQTDTNGITSSWAVDDFGRTTLEIRPDGTRLAHYYCTLATAGLDTSGNTAGCPTPAAGEAPADAISMEHRELRSAAGAKIGAYTRVFYDRNGRELRTSTEAFDGASQPGTASLIATDTIYTNYGPKYIQSRPYFLGNKSSTTGGSNDVGLVLFGYDALGRVITVVNADNSAPAQAGFGPNFGARNAAYTSTVYSGLKVTTYDDQGHIKIEEKDITGRTARITDDYGAQMSYGYDAFGNVLLVQDALHNQITAKFDIRGQRVSLNDPDAGTWTYCHDALGQLTAQQNSTMRATSGASSTCPSQTADATNVAATKVTGWSTFAYDGLGRLTQRYDPESLASWSYDVHQDGSACAGGIGQLCSSTSNTGSAKNFAFDGLGRVVAERDDTGTGQDAFILGYGYDATTGYLSTKTYPTGLQVKYAYTPRGYTEKLLLNTAATLTPLPNAQGTTASSASLPAGSVLWQGAVRNAWGDFEKQTLGNGTIASTAFTPSRGQVKSIAVALGAAAPTIMNQSYSWDSVRNLTGRTDALGDGKNGAVTEALLYDHLNRLVDYKVSAVNVPNQNREVLLNYNAVGDLLYKSDVGAFTYGNGNGPGVIRPHAVTDLFDSTNIDHKFGYDNNGNLVTTSAEKYASVAYTSFNLPDGSAGIKSKDTGLQYTYAYDVDHARIFETRISPQGTRTTRYVNPDNAGGLGFEREVDTVSGATIQTNRHYLSVNGEAIGMLASTGAVPALVAGSLSVPSISSIALNKVEYWHKDFQGSIAAATDQAGTLTAAYAYDPFGKRRYTDGNYDAAGKIVVDWSDTTNAGTGRGYTGHEQMDDIGLVHMNGRIYDPNVSRMLQADPDITDITNLQNTNRYSYVLNNPMRWVDPTGYSAQPEIIYNSGVAGSDDLEGKPSGSANGRIDFQIQAAITAASTPYSSNSYNNYGWSSLAYSGQTSVGGGAGVPSSFTMLAGDYGITDAVRTAWRAALAGEEFFDGGFGARAAAAYARGEYTATAVYELAGTVSVAQTMLTDGLTGVERAVAAIGVEAAAAKVAAKTAEAGFASEAKLLSHFEKHGAEFGAKNANDYLQIGKDIMQYGDEIQYVYKGETRTGFAQFMGNRANGASKFGFVGTNADGAITTIHTESGNSFWKMLNGSLDKTIYPVP
ncbi:RHS repeat-associated core domain-containing protein [Amantichitinum ursilacus]|nr:RHS repeat-associated core domain-containing protein [Amantichitinum ursilacus]